MSLPPAVSPAELQFQTTALLCPLALGGQFFMILYGLYLVQHFQYCRSTLYAKLTSPVKSTLWIVCFLVTVYMGLLAADVTYWMGTLSPDVVRLHTDCCLYSHNRPLSTPDSLGCTDRHDSPLVRLFRRHAGTGIARNSSCSGV